MTKKKNTDIAISSVTTILFSFKVAIDVLCIKREYQQTNIVNIHERIMLRIYIVNIHKRVTL